VLARDNPGFSHASPTDQIQDLSALAFFNFDLLESLAIDADLWRDEPDNGRSRGRCLEVDAAGRLR